MIIHTIPEIVTCGVLVLFHKVDLTKETKQKKKDF